jgi:phytoene dehydrogenase-like protein
MSQSIIIIGAGIAGLSAGCYARMNGYDATIFELHSQPGGLCTAWNRKGYTFDGCIHYLFGSGPGQPFHDVWAELGAVQDRPMVNHDEFMQIVGANGERLIVYSDPDRLETHLKSIAPEDAGLIDSFVDGIRTFTEFDMSLLQAKPRSTMSAEEWRDFGLGIMPFALPLAKWGLVSAAEFATRFKNPFLRRAIPLMFAWPDCPVMVGQSLLAYMHTGNAGFPVGGSLEFARAIERRFLALGGEIRYDAQVQKILVRDGRAAGVRLYDDTEHWADIVISAADGRGTLFDWLGEAYLDRDMRRTYDGHLPIHSVIQVSLGVARDLSAEPHWASYLLDEPLTIATQPVSDVGVKHFCFDPTLAPEGKSAVTLLFEADYHYWQRIYARRIYDREQSQISDTVCAFLDGLYPGFSSDVEVKDVATPMSYERFTGNWLGSSCGWLLTKDTMRLMIQGLPKTLPKLGDFYMAGQWVEPGGSVPVAAMSGRNAIQLICHEAGRPFQTSRP